MIERFYLMIQNNGSFEKKRRKVTKKNNKILFYFALLILGISLFYLQLFVWEAPDGTFGFLLCLFSIYLMIGSVIQLCKLSKTFSKTLFAIFDSLF